MKWKLLTRLLLLAGVLSGFAPLAQAFYNPSTGRWLSRDPIEERGGANPYGFSANDGLNKLDLFGLKPTKQCTLNGSPFSLTFDGKNLSGGGFSAQAVSGVPLTKKTGEWVDYSGVARFGGDVLQKTFDYSDKAQTSTGGGPIPKGSYWFEVCEGRNLFSNGEGFPASRDHLFGSGSWGTHSWSLHPEESTQTHGRSGFFIHGGRQWGSLGCIDIGNSDTQLGNVMRKMKKQCECCYVPVTVNYVITEVTLTERLLTWWDVPSVP